MESAETAIDPVAIARCVREEDPVCDFCTGRLVADRSFGLGNDERGRALRIAAALIEDIPYEAPNPEDCWVCEGQCSRAEEWASRVVKELEQVSFSTYQVGCRIPPLLEENDRLLRQSCGLDEEAGELLKSDLNREVGKRVGEITGTTVDFDRPDILALLHIERGDVEIEINPAFVYGRYRKEVRDIPQTEWPCRDCGATGKQLGPNGEEPCDGCDGTGYRYDVSIEGLTVPTVVTAMEGSEGVFHGAGREDVDARMLGSGRPFVIEVKDPHRRDPDPEAIKEQINEAANGAVTVSDLALATYEMVERVKALEASKRYEARVLFEEPVTEEALNNALERIDGATITQYTPQRVDHRRANLTRERTVYAIDGTRQSPTEATVTIHGAGGLYVKELISGDDGRTEPSLAGEVGVPATVTALDVLAVEGEDERFDQPAFLRSRDNEA